MRVPPIPVRLRPDTARVRVPADAELGGEYAEPVEIGHVRLDGARELVRSGYVLADGCKGVLYVDATSEGAFAIPEGSLVEVRGAWMCASRVTPCEAFDGRVHHWEVELT